MSISREKLTFDLRETNRETILEVIDNNLLTVHFQPIFSSKDGTVFGHEALARIKGQDTIKVSIERLFKQAILTGTISFLDLKCREEAIKLASSLSIKSNGSYLFINVCPETLADPSHSPGITDKLAEEFDISKEKIVFEITEEATIRNYGLFLDAILYYKKRGYKIAIDDFGVGYGGLKMLSMVEPDFLKIDRNFVTKEDKTKINYNIIESVLTVCHKIGIRVVAEGIEDETELRVLKDMGIDFFQGYYLGRPEPLPRFTPFKALLWSEIHNNCHYEEVYFVGDIASKIEPISPEAPITEAVNRFMTNYILRSIPVVEDERIVGILHRNRFLENQVFGRLGYGIHLNSRKLIKSLMEEPSLIVEANVSIEEVSQRLQNRHFDLIYDDICVTEAGRYYGMVPVNVLLKAITEKSIILAKNANPLTGLPGNEFIQREINKRLAQNIDFDVCYIDINNFKPYNDHYGFEKGDMVIKTLGSIISNVANNCEPTSIFAGHIGGDDFIVITPCDISISTCERIISAFKEKICEFHNPEELKNGYYTAKNRKNEEEMFKLLSISIGIVSTKKHNIKSFGQLASIATEVKKFAKLESTLTGQSSIVMDRRQTRN
jgi:diguanylate cyclase (GGDEF)-like protein